MAAPFQYLLITVKVDPSVEFSLVTHKILTLLVNTLTVNDKDYLLNRDNLTRPIQMQLSQKQEIVCQIFFGFLKCTLNLKHFPKKDDPHT